jgi:hypothetical protein
LLHPLICKNITNNLLELNFNVTSFPGVVYQRWPSLEGSNSCGIIWQFQIIFFNKENFIYITSNKIFGFLIKALA